MDSKTMNAGILKILIIIVGAVLIIYAYQYLLIFFGAVIFANFVKRMGVGISKKIKGSASLWSSLIWVIVLGLLGLFFYLSGAKMVNQFTGLVNQTVENYQSLYDQVVESDLFESKYISNINLDPVSEGGLNILSSLINIPFLLLLMLFLSVVLTFENHLIFGYIQKMVQGYVPDDRQALKKLHSSADVLNEWLINRLLSMLVVTILTTVVLLLIGMPFAFVLGILAGLLSFIPNLGPILGFIPALLISFSQGGNMPLIVLIVYLSIQLVESNFITPFIFKSQLKIPIAATLMLQFIFGVLFGILGVMFSVPIGLALGILANKEKTEKAS
jgi:predicted PurR-regulated permease PerM